MQIGRESRFRDGVGFSSSLFRIHPPKPGPSHPNHGIPFVHKRQRHFFLMVDDGTALTLDGGHLTGPRDPPQSILSPVSAHIKFDFRPLSIAPLSNDIWKDPGDHGPFLAPFEDSPLAPATARYVGLNLLSQYCFLHTDGDSLLLRTQGDNSEEDRSSLWDIFLLLKKEREYSQEGIPSALIVSRAFISLIQQAFTFFSVCLAMFRFEGTNRNTIGIVPLRVATL